MPDRSRGRWCRGVAIIERRAWAELLGCISSAPVILCAAMCGGNNEAWRARWVDRCERPHEPHRKFVNVSTAHDPGTVLHLVEIPRLRRPMPGPQPLTMVVE